MVGMAGSSSLCSGHDHVVDHAVLRDVLPGEQRCARRRARRAVRVVVGELEAFGEQPLPPRQLHTRRQPRPVAFLIGDDEKNVRACQPSRARMPTMDERPPIWVGHVVLEVADPQRSAPWWESIGLRPVHTGSDVSIMELRGGTHLIMVPGEPKAGDAPFDLQVDDVDAMHATFVARAGWSPRKSRVPRSTTPSPSPIPTATSCRSATHT